MTSFILRKFPSIDMIQLQIKPRGRPIKNLPSTVKVDLATSTAEDLYARLSSQTGLSRDRLRLTKGSDGNVVTVKKESGKDVMLEELGLRDGSMVYVKDLGPQIGWRTVFVIEYLGPLVLHPLVYFFLRRYIYLNSKFNPLAYIPFLPTYDSTDAVSPPTSTQALLCFLITLNFVKREIETLFVHRFSASTMPFSYVFRNSAHYWILCGVNMAIFLYIPAESTAASWWPKDLLPEKNEVVAYGTTALWVFAQISNFITHMTLRRLRPAGSRKRAIPSGYGFDSVTCPNYSFEVLSWIAVTILSGGNWSAWVFAAVGGFTMLRWAKKKERRYRKEFGSVYKKKNVMIPGLL